MKTALNVIAFFLGIIYLPFSIYASYLLYRHVGATELMWFLWWATTPMAVITTILASAAQKLVKD